MGGGSKTGTFVETAQPGRPRARATNPVATVSPSGYQQQLSRADAEKYGMMIAVHLEACRWELARNVIDAAEKHAASSVDAANADKTLAEIGLPPEIVNALERELHAFRVMDILRLRPERLLQIPGFSAKRLETIFTCLAKLGFHRQTPEKNAS